MYSECCTAAHVHGSNVHGYTCSDMQASSMQNILKKSNNVGAPVPVDPGFRPSSAFDAVVGLHEGPQPAELIQMLLLYICSGDSRT